MENSTKAKWALIDLYQTNKVYLYSEEPRSYDSSLVQVKDVSLDISEGVLSITGTKIQFTYVYSSVFDDLETIKQTISESSIKFGYKNLLHRLLAKKTPYVNGWCKLKDTAVFNLKTSNWTIKDYRNVVDMY